MPITKPTETNEVRKQTQAAYEADKLRAAQRNIHVFASIASVVNLLLIISDLIFIQGRPERLMVAIARYTFSILLIFMIRVLQKARTYASFTTIVTVLEATSAALYFFVLRLYESPDFMIQSMGLIALILVIFIVPNRSGNILALSISGAAVFFAFTYFWIQNRTLNELIAAMTYMVLTILLCSVAAFGNERNAYRDFSEKTRLKQTSSIDFLTSAVTRARLEEEARRWMSFCRRQGLPLCLVFADVDNLKRINDRYGHAAGDMVLKNLTGLMQSQLRSSDTIARWGGDEFVLLLPNVSLQNALFLLDRVKESVMRAEFENIGTISCSFGVVEMGPDSTYQELLAEADTMMYKAKKNGKGRISYRETVQFAEEIASNL